MISDKFFAQLPSNYLILTPNQRLASFIEQEFHQWQKINGLQTWETIKIYPLETWLKHICVTNHHFDKKLLSDLQVKALWQNLIVKLNPELLNLEAALQQALEAMRFLCLWKLNIRDNEFENNLDSKQFKLWYEHYQKQCQEKGWIDNFHALFDVIDHFDYFKNHVKEVNCVYLLGFDEIPPLWQNLFDLIQTQIAVENIDFFQTPQSKTRLQFEDFPEELQQTIYWLKKTHEQNPSARLACIIPNLGQKYAYVEKSFQKHFNPKSFMAFNSEQNLPYNISSGQNLQSYHLIATANKLLGYNWQKKQIPLEIIKLVLQSHFIKGANNELSQRQAVLLEIASLQCTTLSLSYFYQIVKASCPILFDILKRLQNQFDNEKKTLPNWFAYFDQCLEILGWPGEQTLSSESFQLIQRYKQLWNELLCLDELTNVCDINSAQTIILHACKNLIFQTRTGEKPIQVLGTLEAAGIYFDQIWIMQCDERTWPAPANPNPLIPYPIQTQKELPHSSAEREWQFANTLFNRLIKSAEKIFVSSCQYDEENQIEIRASSLCEHWPLTKPTFVSSDPMLDIQKSRCIETFNDSQPKAIGSKELQQLKGGIGILKAQAACPFKAFATYRLQAQRMPIPEPGLNALERGNIVHSGLEFFWRRIKNQKHLLSLSETELDIIIEECLRAAILAIHLPNQHNNKKLLHIEIQRLKVIFHSWLQLEKKRQDFTVYSVEQSLQKEFFGLPLNLRIDRVDKLTSGALILIDYKTGLASPQTWLSERISEPQLPLYALIFPEEVNGIVFGQVKKNHFSIKGIINAKHLSQQDNTSGINLQAEPEWTELKSFWEQQLSETASAFLAGDAKVEPDMSIPSCQFCEFSSLCRIEELKHDSK